MDVRINYCNLIIGLIMVLVGMGCAYFFLKKYSIKVKGKCIYSHVGYHTNQNHFSYEIEGKEYEGKGVCMLPKRKGKIYNLRVNKDNPEEFMTGPIMFSLVGAGLMILLLSFIIV